MKRKIYDFLQLREIFHLEFLRWLGRKIKVEYYALKGGVNLRFFFKSIRYSEDMDLDAQKIKVEELKEAVITILNTPSFQEHLIPFGIVKVIPPNIKKAKQIETTQRFKVHLLTSSGEDLFTKIEFSRRGFKGRVVVQPVSSAVLRAYTLSPLIVPHYDVQSAINQKIEAVITRSVIQPRDIFDLHVLIPQCNPADTEGIQINSAKLKMASERILGVGFEQFRDTVLSYLSQEEQSMYNSKDLWDEIKLRVTSFIEQLQK